jgi:protease htpX homolog
MLYDQIKKNKRRTILVVFLYIVLFVLIGAAAGYYLGIDPRVSIIGAGVFAVIYTFIMMSNSTSVVMYMNNAYEVTSFDEKTCILNNILEDMALIANVPKPKLYIIDSEGLNAFATGPNHENSAVAVTRGLLNTLNRAELEGVVAHEMAHIRNYDIRLQTITVALGAVISIIVQFTLNSFRSKDNENNNPILLALSVVGLILGVIIAPMINLAISRQREYQADATAVKFTRNPKALISALNKISGNAEVEDVGRDSSGMYIANPMDSEWFSTHPKMEKRIKRLENM